MYRYLFAGQIVAPTSKTIESALLEVVDLVTPTNPAVLVSNGREPTSWPLVLLTSVGMATDAHSTDCTWMTYAEKFLLWGTLNPAYKALVESLNYAALPIGYIR